MSEVSLQRPVVVLGGGGVWFAVHYRLRQESGGDAWRLVYC